MKFRSPLRVALAGIMAMSILNLVTSCDTGSRVVTRDVAQKHVPHPVPKFTIDLSDMGRGSYVHRLTFSPDGNYLAIADMPDLSTATIIVWDLQNNREITRIKGLPPFGVWPNVKLLWSPDGKYLTYGSGGGKGAPLQFWDPMTGRVNKELDVLGSRLQYNKDGSKFVLKTIYLENNKLAGGFRIYDAVTWEFKDFEHDGLEIETIAWTAEGKILVAGTWPWESVGKSLDDVIPKRLDGIVRLIDPSGKDAPRTVILFPSVPVDTPGKFKRTFDTSSSLSDFAGNRIAISTLMLDGRTLEILYNFATDEDIINKERTGIGSGGVFSPDGNYLYLARFNRNCDESKFIIVNTSTNEDAAFFNGGCEGLAISSDGNRLAVGNGRSVKIFDVQ